MEINAIADLILDRLTSEKEQLASQYQESKDGIGHFYVDDLLPEDLASEIFQVCQSANRFHDASHQ